jgi:CDP-diglyceride synthetase
MELLVIVAYAGLLALVAPFVMPRSEHFGNLVPGALALTSGSVLWLLLTWFGFPYNEAWIWMIVMLLMPVATWFGTSFIRKTRETEEANALEAIRLGRKA